MIVSNDTMMQKPPYEITSEILQLVSEISMKIGAIHGQFLVETNPKLRKQNRIKTIHSSLAIEGNALSEAQVTAILEDKRVLGPEKDITEVLNALEVYKQLDTFDFKKEKDFLQAHKILLQNLVPTPGKYRNHSAGIAKGSEIHHIAPPHENVPFQMKNLFAYLADKQENALIKSCVFHYELEFIHPFSDGNGRMGRLWQTLILSSAYPLFKYLPFETLISHNQKQYYQVLSACDRQGKSTLFITYMLGIINRSLADLLATESGSVQKSNRMAIFLNNRTESFTRKDYLQFFKSISAPTASRDLANAVAEGILQKSGEGNLTFYRKI